MLIRMVLPEALIGYLSKHVMCGVKEGSSANELPRSQRYGKLLQGIKRS